MNGYTVIYDGHVDDSFPVAAVSGLYRALAVAEAEWEAHRERAILDGVNIDDDEADWDLALMSAAGEPQ